jgi:hypothetical protein
MVRQSGTGQRALSREAAKNFRRKFFFLGDFPVSAGKVRELGLFAEKSSRNPANLLAGTPARP